jgi:hypothetical protein
MKTVTAYRLGDDYSFHAGDAAERVTVVRREGIEVRKDPAAIVKVFPAGTPSGFTLATALVLNWCTVLEEALDRLGAADRVPRCSTHLREAGIDASRTPEEQANARGAGRRR